MRKILVVTDPEFSNEVALNRLREVPKDTLYRVEHYLSPTQAKDASSLSQALQEKKTWLEELVAPLISDGYQVETAVHSYGKLHETIIAHAIEFEADYVFKPVRQHSALQRLMYTSTDWNLVRFCPCPLLLISGKPEVHGKPVLAALDLESKDEAHRQLNDIVLERSHAIASLIEGQVHLVNAYNLLTIAGGNTSLSAVPYDLIKSRRADYYEKASKIAEREHIEAEQIHLNEGAAEMVVNDVAEQIDAGIIVLGTLARTGASGLFIGNTAESVLEGASSDIIVVKQRANL